VTAALPSIPQAVIQAYRDLVHSIRTLRRLVGIAFLILLAAGIIQHLLRLDDDTERSRLLLGFLLGAAQQFLLMPYYLAVHRLVILDEATRSYRLAPREPGFQRFYWLSVAFDFLLFLPTMMMPLLAPLRIRYQVALFMIAFFVTAYVFLRLIVIFPAFAVDAPGATLKNAYADTKGRSWRTLGIILLAHLPFIPALVALAMLVGDPKTGRSPSIVMDVAGGAIGVLLVTLLIVIASRLYMSIGDRTKGSGAG
jgi:hypothetical protein